MNMSTINNVNYKDTFLWILCVQEQPQVADFLDSLESKSVSALSDGLRFKIFTDLSVNVRFDMQRGLFVDLEIAGVSNDCDFERVRSTYVEHKLRIEQASAAIHESKRVQDLINTAKYAFDLGQSGLSIKEFLDRGDLSLEIGYYDSYSGFESLHSVNCDSSEIQSTLDIKNLCARLIREYVDLLNQDLNHLLSKE